VGDIWSIFISIQMMDGCWQVEDSKMLSGPWCGKRTFMLTWITTYALKMEENGK
jgi:hypothetical protein